MSRDVVLPPPGFAAGAPDGVLQVERLVRGGEGGAECLAVCVLLNAGQGGCVYLWYARVKRAIRAQVVCL